jgi:sigma-B regulation protein RsbU (phosphoserine phosphatase)
MFVTMVAGIFDPATGHIEIANAGHEPPLVHGRDGTFSAIEAGAPPLGIVPDLEAAGPIAVTELDLDGGALYIFTDGVTESESEDGIDSDVEALMAVISGAASLPLAQRPAAIVAGIGGGSGTLRDDMTVLVIQAGEGASGKGART